MQASAPTVRRFAPADLVRLGTSLFEKAGMDAEKAEAQTRFLVLTDMMRRYTHGLAQLVPYLDEIGKGTMMPTGEPEVLRDTGSTVVWDGRFLPGLWLSEKALELGFERVAAHGVVTFAIRRSHHIGCLAALAKQATDRGLVVIIASAGPHASFAAPYGGTTPLFTPDPFAIGYPTSTTPVLVDMSATYATVAMTREKARRGEEFEHPWLLDNQGRPTRDPTVLEKTDPRGSLILVGGAEAGHKGYGLALMVEVLSLGLAGFGRADKPTNWGGGVFLQLLDPDAFAGREAFLRQMDFISDACHASAPVDPDKPVRLPGEQSCRFIADAEANGVALRVETVAALKARAADMGVDASILA